ncbi:MAG: cyclic nucleotide-binding domain-containing protein [Vulcanimicrobiota bacterium]
MNRDRNNNWESLKIQDLSRGGILVKDEGLLIEIGAYPETIKDSMNQKHGVPDIFLIPEKMFDIKLGISTADLEFPAYFNFFLKNKKLKFICRKDQLRPLLTVLKEATFGPANLDISQDYLEGEKTPGFPNLKRELDYFKQNPRKPGQVIKLKNIIEPLVFDENNQVTINGLTITDLKDDKYRFEKEEKYREIQFEYLVNPVLPTDIFGPAALEGFYSPPSFGITVIGSGHGFDARGITTGFILWIDGKGILVDPPVNTTAWLKRNRINTRLIQNLILTHCHADHDSGTLQKILEEGRIKVHTTETIANSFMAKYGALLGISRDEFRKLFQLDPVKIGHPINIAGGQFVFKYCLHSIPTINFTVKYQNGTFAFSSDTLYEPETFTRLYEEGILDRERMSDLLDFSWNSDLIFHEAGIPPIHTPIKVLEKLPDSTKKRLYLSHISSDSLSETSQLRIAQPGVGNTIIIKAETARTNMTTQMLDVMAHTDLFKDLKVDKALEFLSITKHKDFKPGDIIIREGTYGNRFFMILSGEVEVRGKNIPGQLIYSRYDYIGETAIILNQPRNANVIAATEVRLLYMEWQDFLHFIRDTGLKQELSLLAKNRREKARWLFEKNKVFKCLSPFQKNQLLKIMTQKIYPQNSCIFRKDENLEYYYWLATGELQLFENNREFILERGALAGDFKNIFENKKYTGDLFAKTESMVYRIPTEKMKFFFKANPGSYLRMLAQKKNDDNISVMV